jgi:hypothetical protein
MKEIDKKQIESWKLFRWIALMGAAELMEIIAPATELNTKYSTYSESNARYYFLLKVLIEVQKTGAAIDRWVNYVETSIPELRDKQRLNYIELQLEALIDEQSVWQRKLVESLIMLICFSGSNHDRYYYHYLLLKDLEHYVALRNEQRAFFNGENNYREHAIKITKEKIKLAEKSIDDISKCWYLYPKKKAAGQDTNRLLSLRQSLLKALKVATTREKTSIGYTYESSFAEASRNIHFNPIRSDFDNCIKRFEFGVAQCSSLIVSILNRSQQLSGITPKGLSKHVSKIDHNRTSITNPAKGIAEVGDFVLAGGLYLGEVLEIKESIFGYESYRVTFLDERPMQELAEDLYPAFNVELYRSKKSLIEDARSELKEVEIKHGWHSMPFSDEEIIDASRDAVIEVWKRAYRDWLKHSLKDYLIRNANRKF